MLFALRAVIRSWVPLINMIFYITINLDLEKKHDTCMAVIEMVDPISQAMDSIFIAHQHTDARY